MTGATRASAGILKAVREKMSAGAIAVLIVPSSDAHNSEYVAEHLQRRAFLTNFHGSAGTAVITMERAMLWTDGRYWVEAASCLYPEFTLMKQGQLDVPAVEEWIAQEVGPTATVGMDPFVCTVAEWERLSRKLNLTPFNDVIGGMMPSAPAPKPLYLRPSEFSGATVQDRRDSIALALEKAKCDFTVLSALDEIAWLTNLRGSDVEYNPVFYAYAVVSRSQQKVKLYLNLAKVKDELKKQCEASVEFLPYEQLLWDLETMQEGRAVLVDERQTSQAIFGIFTQKKFAITRTNCGPAQKLKAIKNDVELKGFRDCHVRDGAALTRYLAWLHDQIAVKRATDIDEFGAAKKLQGFRATDSRYVQLSFGTISSTGANGAMCHYQAPEKGSAVIKADALYLVDSGAQYWDGTTDVTRTISFDPPKPEERENYTRVLQGHIAMDTLVFPKGTAGVRLDAFARRALWQVGLDYSHGTGHGVGSMLCVHEGPHGVGVRPVPTDATVDLHTIVTNEPGYYKEGHYGIRIENQEEVVQAETPHGKDAFLTLSPLTMAPLCRDLIDVSLLTEQERSWVNAYHDKVAQKLTPLLAGDDLALAYLRRHTEHI